MLYPGKTYLLAGAVVAIGVAATIFFMLKPGRVIPLQAQQQMHTDVATIIASIFPRTKEHDFDSPIPGSYKLPVIKAAGNGDVLDIYGKPRKLFEFMDGKITVLSFMYALCSDTQGCPLATSTLIDARDVSKQLPRLARNTRFLSLSFNPERDTPEAMESYGYPILVDPDGKQKISWDFLTTASKKQLKPILKAYGQVINPEENGETISHLLRLYLIDKKKRVRNIYGLGFLDPRNLFADIETLLMEENVIARSN